MKVLVLVPANSVDRWIGTAEQLRMECRTPGVLSTTIIQAVLMSLVSSVGWSSEWMA